MKKYTGLIVLASLAATSLLAVRAAPDDKQWSRKGTGVSESQIGQLDKRLSERITEQQELLAIVEKLLSKDFQQKIQEPVSVGNVLSGQVKPVASLVVAKMTVKAAEPPWWQDLKPQMVYLSGNDRYAVVNGKMYTHGQTLGKDIVLDSIEDDAVVFSLKGERHTYVLKK